MDRDQAVQWVSRWDAQQEWYMPDREERFTVLIDAAEAGVGRDDPLVLDLGCGPGSLAVRLLDRMPAARVVAIDTDPLLLALGRVDEHSETFLTVGHVPLLLGVPPADPPHRLIPVHRGRIPSRRRLAPPPQSQPRL